RAACLGSGPNRLPSGSSRPALSSACPVEYPLWSLDESGSRHGSLVDFSSFSRSLFSLPYHATHSGASPRQGGRMTALSMATRDRRSLVPGFAVFLLLVSIALVSAHSYAGGWNDGSRLATVECLVDYHTLAIDRSIFVQVPPVDSSVATPYAKDE